MNFLSEYIQLVFCGVDTSEASLAWCYDVAVFEPPIQTFDTYPLYQCSDMMSVMLALYLVGHFSLCSSSLMVIERRSSNLLEVVLFSM